MPTTTSPPNVRLRSDRKTTGRPRLPGPIRPRRSANTQAIPRRQRSPTLAPRSKHPTAPLQYRLEIIGGGLTSSQLDAFIESGFVEDAGFDLQPDGMWHQTTLEGDTTLPAMAEDA